MSAPLVLLLYTVNPHSFSDKIIKFPIIIGVAFSIHAIILWGLVFSGFEIDYSFVSKPMVGRTLRYNSFWGNMTFAANSWSGVSRAVGFFLEPDRFGRFLQYSAFVSLGYYMLNRKYIYLLSSLLCFFVVVLTLSAANVFAIVSVIFLYLVSNKLYKIKILKKFTTLPFVLACVFGFLMASSMHSYFNNDSTEENYQNPDQIIDGTSFAVKRLSGGNYEKIYHFLIHSGFQMPTWNKPFGHSFDYQVNNDIFMSQYAIEGWINIGGLPILIIIMIYFFHMFTVHVIPAFTNSNPGIVCYVALAYTSHTIMHLQHGTWWDPFYFYITAVLVLLKSYNFAENYNIAS